MAASGDRGASLRLDAVYTALMTQSATGGDGARDFSRSMDPQRLSALAQLDRHDRLVLLGDPGSGKSTFVSFVALCMAGAILKDREANLKILRSPLPGAEAEEEKPKPQPWRHGPLVPVRVILRDLAAHGLPDSEEQITASHLWKFIEKTLADQEIGEYAPFLKNELQTRGGLVLLDGFDEVPDADRRREQIKEMVHAFSRGFGQCRILLTSRTYAYQKQEWRLPDFTEVVLALWTDGQIQRFVGRWYDHAAALERLRAEDAEGRAALLRQAIFSNPRLLDLARRPLLLTLIASLHAWRSGSLPDGRAELYEDAVKLLLDFWEMARVRHKAGGEKILLQPSLTEFLRVDQKEVREVLEDLAFEAHEAQPDTMETADVDEGRLLTKLAALSREAAVNPILLRDYLCDRAGLLIHRGVGVFTFPHRTFQEYLAACYLTRDEFPDRVASLAMENPGRWREVLLLAAARAAGRVGSTVWNLSDALCGPEAGEPGESSLSALWGAYLAGQALVESAKLPTSSPGNLRRLERLRKWFVHLLGDSRLPAIERAQAGCVLAKLDDPRPEVTTVAGMAQKGLCRVKAGPFRMGSEDGDPQAFDDEKPAHDCDIPYEYRIGRYPVTVAQFRQFVEASRFELGNLDCLRGPDNHPVMRVSWHEAVAFCEWVTEVSHQEGWLEDGWGFRLPSEAEWEKAARGTDGRIYPWGPDPDPNLANYGDTGIGGLSTVGCFPGGASPYGCEEMSGNVWEWTLSPWVSNYAREDRENVNRSDSEERLRVVRGGAFFYASRSVRCAFRSGSDPGYWVDFIGFRVAAVPFSSGP